MRSSTRDRCPEPKAETANEKPEPAANEEEGNQKPHVTPDGEQKRHKRNSRLAMTLQEAETIAQNLKESGTRR